MLGHPCLCDYQHSRMSIDTVLSLIDPVSSYALFRCPVPAQPPQELNKWIAQCFAPQPHLDHLGPPATLLVLQRSAPNSLFFVKNSICSTWPHQNATAYSSELVIAASSIAAQKICQLDCEPITPKSHQSTGCSVYFMNLYVTEMKL